MRHFKILGWLWLVFGLFWSFAAACAVIAAPAQLKTASAWWTDVIVNSLEGSYFVAAAVFGFGLLRRWRRAHVMVGVLGGVLLAVSLVAFPGPWFPPTTVPMKMVWLSPFLSLALYSLVTPLLIKYEPKAA